MTCVKIRRSCCSGMTVYLDHNATSPLHPQVAAAMMPFLREPPANPSSLHAAGRMARSALDSARAQVASLLNCGSDEIIFTSGGTEANNLFLKGYIDFQDPRPIVSTEIEHPSVLQPLRQLQATGRSVVLLKPDASGRIDLDAAAETIAEARPPGRAGSPAGRPGYLPGAYRRDPGGR